MSRWNLAVLLGLPAVVLLGLAVQLPVILAAPPDTDYQLVRTLVDVLAEVDKSYVRRLSHDEKKKLVEDMINGGLERLDPHSQFFNEDELKAFDTQTEGQFGGIGVLLQVDPKTGYLKVETPMPGTPAYEAGIQAGDLLTAVEGKSTQGMRLDEARNLIKGKPGSPVALQVQGEGDKEPRPLTLTRGTIELHPVSGVARRADDPTKWDYLYDKAAGIALIRVLAFNEKTDAELKAAIKEAEAAGARALILDMRDNPGGLLSQAVSVADLFLDDGMIVGTGSKQPDGTLEVSRSWTAKAGDTVLNPPEKHPMVVLVNGNTASASEIVASALQDHGRAAVAGERSFGKGSVQKVFPLPDRRSAVKLTTEVWLTPQKKNIHRWPDATDADEWGVRPTPGLEVKLTDEQRREYIAHVRGLDMVKGKPGMAKPAPPTVGGPGAEKGKPYADPVAEKAADYLRGKLRAAGGGVGAWGRAV